jgi:CCR4-NOT transcriptional regulation complex NOT5 subunit
MNLLNYLLGAALLGAALTNCTTYNRLQAERLAHQTTQSEHATAMAAAHAAQATEESLRRKTEQELTDAQEAHAREIAALRLNRDRDRAAGAAVAQRVRDTARAAAELAGQVCADSTTAELRASAADAARVLAELRERADDRAGILARAADDAHLAGLACERRYEEARETLKGAAK